MVRFYLAAFILVFYAVVGVSVVVEVVFPFFACIGVSAALSVVGSLESIEISLWVSRDERGCQDEGSWLDWRFPGFKNLCCCGGGEFWNQNVGGVGGGDGGGDGAFGDLLWVVVLHCIAVVICCHFQCFFGACKDYHSTNALYSEFVGGSSLLLKVGKDCWIRADVGSPFISLLLCSGFQLPWEVLDLRVKFEAEFDLFSCLQVSKLGLDPYFESGLRFFLACQGSDVLVGFVDVVTVPF